ncbi:hypothetical protein [Enterococcus casseliflavus]|uniref:hypothetical protein n=1 Tax=Enterococcus casseliflavus TaxID=37734 RepID=UPI00301A008A
MSGYEKYYGKETKKLLEEGAKIKIDTTILADINSNLTAKYLVSLQSQNGKDLFKVHSSTDNLVDLFERLEQKILQKNKKVETDKFPFQNLVNKVKNQQEIIYGKRQFHGWEVRHTEDKILIHIYRSGNLVLSFDKDSNYSNISLNVSNVPLYVERDKTAFFDVLAWVKEYLNVSRETRSKEFVNMF